MKIPRQAPEWLKLASKGGYLSAKDMMELFACSRTNVDTIGIKHIQIKHGSAYKNHWPAVDVINFIMERNDERAIKHNGR